MLIAPSEDQAIFAETTERFLVELAPPDTLRRLRDDPAGFDRAYWRAGPSWGGPRCWWTRPAAAARSAAPDWWTLVSWPTSSATTPRRDPCWRRTSSRRR